MEGDRIRRMYNYRLEGETPVCGDLGIEMGYTVEVQLWIELRLARGIYRVEGFEQPECETRYVLGDTRGLWVHRSEVFLLSCLFGLWCCLRVPTVVGVPVVLGFWLVGGPGQMDVVLEDGKGQVFDGLLVRDV
jgi:hypothetical protein